MTLTELNSCTRNDFVAAIGWVFEHSPWVAERVADERPFQSLDRLHAAMEAVVVKAPHDEQLSLLRAHPDLGTRAAMTQSSTSEQRSAGLDRLAGQELERLQRLNAAYREKFGFPFLYAVKGSTLVQVLQSLERRSASSPEAEMSEALRQASRIARFRLEATIAGT